MFVACAASGPFYHARLVPAARTGRWGRSAIEKRPPVPRPNGSTATVLDVKSIWAKGSKDDDA